MDNFEVVKTDAGYLLHVTGKYYKVPDGAVRFSKDDLKLIYEGAKAHEVAGTPEKAATATFVKAGNAPVITQQPGAQVCGVGEKATFSVTVVGDAPLKYQWSRGGQPIAGSNAATYTTPITLQSDNGFSYTVAVSNPVAKVTSTNARLTVLQED